MFDILQNMMIAFLDFRDLLEELSSLFIFWS